MALQELPYSRSKAVAYAHRWAYFRNPDYCVCRGAGGDSTNFASQCIYAGSGVMNYTPVTGWYYNSSSDRSPSWTGVQYLYNFLTGNKSVGPYAAATDAAGAVPGDIVQLGNQNGYYHSPVIVAVEDGRIYVAAHTYDAYMRPLDTYIYQKSRFLHIIGVRSW